MIQYLNPLRVSRLLLAGTLLVFAGCASKKEAPAPDYDQISAAIMTATAPQLLGNWALREVHVTYQTYNAGQHELKIKRDTVYQQLATLTIRRAGQSRSTPPDVRYPDFEGELHYQTKTYPVQFTLRAAPDRIVANKGPQGIFFLDYNFPIGSHPTEPEEHFLQYQLGLLGDNYLLEVSPQQPNSMTWRGLNRGVSQVELVRQ